MLNPKTLSQARGQFLLAPAKGQVPPGRRAASSQNLVSIPPGLRPSLGPSGSLESWLKAFAVSQAQLLQMHRSCLASDLQGLIFLVFVSKQIEILSPQPGQPLLYMAHVAAEASFVIGERQKNFIPLLPCKRHLFRDS